MPFFSANFELTRKPGAAGSGAIFCWHVRVKAAVSAPQETGDSERMGSSQLT